MKEIGCHRFGVAARTSSPVKPFMMLRTIVQKQHEPGNWIFASLHQKQPARAGQNPDDKRQTNNPGDQPYKIAGSLHLETSLPQNTAVQRMRLGEAIRSPCERHNLSVSLITDFPHRGVPFTQKPDVRKGFPKHSFGKPHHTLHLRSKRITRTVGEPHVCGY